MIYEIVRLETFINIIGEGNTPGLGLVRYYDIGEAVVILFDYMDVHFKTTVDKVDLVEKEEKTFDEFFNEYLYPLGKRVVKIDSVESEQPEPQKQKLEIRVVDGDDS